MKAILLRAPYAGMPNFPITVECKPTESNTEILVVGKQLIDAGCRYMKPEYEYIFVGDEFKMMTDQ
jgi:hypothetical protein